MVLKYSVALDFDKSKAGDLDTPSAAACWRVTRRCLNLMREAENLPEREVMDGLWEARAAKLAGRRDLDIRWACDSHEGRSEWAFHLLHPGRTDERLLWRLDIACRELDPQTTRVGVRLDVSAIDGGARPYGFSVSSPRIVSELLRTWPAKRGDLVLDRHFRHWRSLPRIRGCLADPDRQVPVVLAGPAVVESAQPLYIRREFSGVSRSLAGIACLAALPTANDIDGFNSGFDASLRFDQGDDFAIYWPIERGSLGSQLSERRKSIRRESYPSQDEVALHLLDLVAQRGVLHDTGKVTSYGIIVRRLEEIERRNERVINVATAREQEELFEQWAQAEERTQELERELAEERHEKSKLEAALRARTAPDPPDGPSGGMDWRAFRRWRSPRNVLEAVKLACEWPGFRGRLVFTEASTKLAARCTFDDPARVLEILMFVASEYLEAVRGGVSGKALETLAVERGFDLATVEKKQTRQDERMMKKRDVTVHGRRVRCEAHFKDGRGVDDALLRVHFAIDGESGQQQIVVGHVGGHLETSGTRRV